MLRRWVSGICVVLLGVAMMAAGGADPAKRFNQLGHNMMCVCGCGQVLLECNHVGCPDSERMIGELHTQVNAQTPTSGGGSPGLDSQILNWFVAKYGATVLAAPIRGGFDDVAWIMPISVFLLATIGTGLLVKRWVGRRALRPVVASAAAGDDALRARIRRETEY